MAHENRCYILIYHLLPIPITTKKVIWNRGTELQVDPRHSEWLKLMSSLFFNKHLVPSHETSSKWQVSLKNHIYIYMYIYIYIWWHQDDGSLRLQILKYMSRNMSCINLNVKHVPHRTDQTVSVAQRNSLLRCGVELTWSAAGGHRVPSGNWNSYSKWPFIVIVDILIKNGDFPELC